MNNRQITTAAGWMVLLAVLGNLAFWLAAVLGNLAFWLALFAGALWLLKHFGVIG